jgi:rhodanese-related sulfurtransferase
LPEETPFSFSEVRVETNRGWLIAVAAMAVVTVARSGHPQADPRHIDSAVIGSPGAKTAEVSTAELKRILAEGSAVVLDARPSREFAISHIPGARNVAARPGVSPSMYVSDVEEVGRLVSGQKDRPLVLYCNGPHCGKSARLSEELLAAGYTNVRRYQLGIPVWRALGNVTAIEAEALGYLSANDRTSVFIDAREPGPFQAGSLAGARNLPRSGVLEGKDVGEVRRAKDDGRLPMEDHNTRIVVVGATSTEARFVAEAIAREAFHNVAYFPGTFEAARAAVGP